MAWHGILGHDEVVEQFRRAIGRGRLASSFLFAGPAGIGKRTFALKLAQAMLCQTRPEAALDPCGECPSCMQALAGTHPDVLTVSKPEGKSEIPVHLFIGPKEHRRQEGLLHEINLKPRMGGRRIAIIDDADYLNDEGANALLKTIEEPPPRSVLILIGASPTKQLPTIRSRCQLIRFRPLPLDVVAKLLVSRGFVRTGETTTGGLSRFSSDENGTVPLESASPALSDAGEANRLARYSEGSIARALELADADLWQFRNTLCQQLAEAPLDSLQLAQAISAFVEEAGKEPAARRNRLRQVISFAVEFYRQLLRTQCGQTPSDDVELQHFIQQAVAIGHHDPERTAARLNRCLDAATHIDRNANQTTLIECWADDLVE
jgi:DNA polymerase-3 subunit delta'